MLILEFSVWYIVFILRLMILLFKIRSFLGIFLSFSVFVELIMWLFLGMKGKLIG